MRTEGDFIKINEWLLPLSWIYGFGVKLRNMLFDTGLLHSESFDVPVISVGNITVGGTGKTPHVEYLIRLLKDDVKVAVLSRGYKRKTRGFVIADDSATARTIGDEPYQMMRKFQDITVAVDRDRCHGIRMLTEGEAKTDIDVVLLDDAFQHRYVKPGVNILLVDYHRLIIYDKMLPAGRLREPLKGKNRADIVIVTKCPHDLKPMEYRVITKAMNLFPFQRLFFTCLDYENLTPLFGGDDIPLDKMDPKQHVLLLTGIASPRQMTEDLKPHCNNIVSLTFGDHHAFTTADVERINATFKSMPQPRMIITTEKDATRLLHIDGLSDEVRKNIYALPVKIRFMLGHGDQFDDFIKGYVQKNSKNSILARMKEEKRERRHSGADNQQKQPKKIVF